MRPLHLAAVALGALAIVGATGTAQPQGRAGKPNVCSLQQRAAVEAAFRLAEVRIAEAIAFLDANPQHEHVTRWFGGGERKLVRLNLTLIQDGLREGRRPRIQCNPPRPCLAFAYARQGEVTLCQRFFDSGVEGQDSHYGTLIHEISHLVAGTRDAAYQPFAAALLAEREPVTAVTNADSYQYFVEFMPR